MRQIARIDRVKVGDVELALAAQAAAEATEAKAQAVEKKLVTEQLGPQEKQQLLNQLRAATAEAERLRGVVSSLAEDDAERQLLLRMQRLPLKDFGALQRLALAVGRDHLLQMSLIGAKQLIRAEVVKVLERLPPEGNERIVSSQELESLRTAGYLGDHDVTDLGIEALVAAARISLIRGTVNDVIQRTPST